MKEVGARHNIIREWRSLPMEQRQTDEQAEAFAMQIRDKYKFSSDSADPYQTVRGWLLSYLSPTPPAASCNSSRPVWLRLRDSGPARAGSNHYTLSSC